MLTDSVFHDLFDAVLTVQGLFDAVVRLLCSRLVGYMSPARRRNTLINLFSSLLRAV